ncbi:hypothetical protein [Chamaesiphon polymorphus]|uniref:Uncharacterized protein n=1 Tax=Chamaesiphon polymorphus CCALA 037 TaxID=2107692 RepID=A0A2T1GFI9_9CYAN|nr:hypothetical protein [Chamaesiphon polymorphus]PSB56346.1 hypothetical protein C7B77_12195 [Chamaesiphon polymorphus CCALA 037]
MNYLPVCNYNVANWCDARDRQIPQQVTPVVGNLPTTCPVKSTELSNLLVRDLPSYANRLIQQRRKRTDTLYSSIVAASEPELKPIEIVSREYSTQFPQAAPTQVFITTLEDQYTGSRVAKIQQFHWLFIAQTRLGWRLVSIYTRTGGFPIATTLISPPIESSKTIVGEAIAIWLNDCYLGKIRA